MIRILVVNGAPIHDCSKDDRKTVAGNAPNEQVMGAVRALCEFSLLVSQQNHPDPSLEAPDNALKQYYQKQGIFQEQIMLRSAKGKVDALWPTESHRLCDQNSHMI
jgi:hypothetical protein